MRITLLTAVAGMLFLSPSAAWSDGTVPSLRLSTELSAPYGVVVAGPGSGQGFASQAIAQPLRLRGATGLARGIFAGKAPTLSRRAVRENYQSQVTMAQNGVALAYRDRY